MNKPIFDRLRFDGFELAPPQTFGPIRLLPVVNPSPREDIRLGLEGYDAYGVVDIGGREGKPSKQYWSYVPHGLIIDWGKDGESTVTHGAELRKNTDPPRVPVKLHHRMAKRTGPQQMRLLPLHLAMEGFLSLQFGGPSIAWSNYSKHAKNFGLSPRAEFTFGAQRIEGLAEAMRLFEIHENQVGVLIFVADALASAFIVSHPEDYRRLHTSVLEDFFAEMFVHYAQHSQIGSLDIALEADGVETLDQLATACEQVRSQWHEQADVLAGGLAERPLNSQVVNQLGHFQLERFITDLDDEREAHIGESIVDQDGALQYLKTYRLSKKQIKRAHLLEMLAKHEWEVEALAVAEGDTPDDVIRRMHNVGFGYLLNPEVLAKAIRPRHLSR